MTYKWIGAALVISASGGFGFSLAASHRRMEKHLTYFLQILDDMECQLQYKLMPLSQLCRSSVHKKYGTVGNLMLYFAEELEHQIAPDPSSCMAAALARCRNLSGNFRYLFSELGYSLGNYDLSGQLKGLETVREKCLKIQKNLECNRELRIRGYQTLGICTGVATAILFL